MSDCLLLPSLLPTFFGCPSRYEDRLPGRAIIVSVIDNLVKGASGQALQNMNLMLGFPEDMGLSQIPMFP